MFEVRSCWFRGSARILEFQLDALLGRGYVPSTRASAWTSHRLSCPELRGTRMRLRGSSWTSSRVFCMVTSWKVSSAAGEGAGHDAS